MKCKNVLQRLLATSGPRRPTEDVLGHLGGCDRCRRWSDRLGEIDAAVVRLPVPDSRRAKSAFIETLLAPAVPAPMWRTRPRRLSWAHIATAIAVALTVVVFVGGLFRGGPRAEAASPPDPMLARVLDRHAELAAADSIERRVEVLEKLSSDLDAQARDLARVAAADDLNVLADLYVAVVGGEKGLLARADEVPAAQRKQILEGLAARFRDAGARTGRMSGEVPSAATAPLQRIATAARDAHSTLNRKLRDEKLAQERVRQEALAQDVPPRPGEGKS